MGTIVAELIDGLRQSGIRAEEVYPGRRIPALTGAVAAVRLGKVDRSVRTAAVQVMIMSPAALGGGTCEQAALRAVEKMQEMGGTCVKDVCKYDEKADVFSIDIEAAFSGTATENNWLPEPGFSVKIGSELLPQAVSFSAGRKLSKGVTSIANAKWEFTLEELLAPGTSEVPDPKEPFSLTVIRAAGEETFEGCTWVSVKREDSIRGVRQIRTGVASSRSVVGI